MKIIDPIESVGMRGANKQAHDEHASMLVPSSVSTPTQDATALADKIENWSPDSRQPLTLIAHERRQIVAALRTASQTPDAVLPPTQEYFLRAMAANYAGGHNWDHLDGMTCTMAADEIKTLREALRATPSASAGPLAEATDEDWNIRKYIDFLRADEGDSVTLLCDNPDFNGQPNCAIECNGYWTNWQDRRFAADTLQVALELAYFQCRQWRENPPPEVSPDPLPAYADPNFKYDEASGAYRRIAAHPKPQQADGRDDKEIGKQMGQYLGMSGIDADDVAYIRNLVAPSADGRGAAIEDIAAERQRQIDVEGWTHKHDDAHDKGEMAHAAGCYALANHGRLLWVGGNEFPTVWPWHKRWWKPKDRRSDLVRAGALIVAEIERLDRAALQQSPATDNAPAVTLPDSKDAAS